MQEPTKVCFILRRYAIKSGLMAGSVCNVVRSIKQVKGVEVIAEYQVWTVNGKTTCNCDSFFSCYHKVHVLRMEDLRVEAEAFANDVTVAPVTTPTPLVIIVPVVVASTAIKAAKAVTPRVKGTLNGNRPFSLPKSYAEMEAEKLAKSA